MSLKAVLFKLIFMWPQLMLNHARQSAALISGSLRVSFFHWKVRIFFYTLSALALCLGVFCSAFSLTLWAALPELNPQHGWILLAFPALIYAVSLLLYLAADRCKTKVFSTQIQEQLKLDLLAICKGAAK